MNVSTTPVLQLNAAYEPTSIISARDAMRLLVKGAAEMEISRGYQIHPDFELPSVIRLKQYHFIPVRSHLVARKNFYARDKYTCQYCVKKFHPSELTLDHVIPESRGGGATWHNLVTCCVRCNRRKANRTPEEAGMPLLNRPRPVSIHTARYLLRSLGEMEDSWRQFLYFENTTPQETV